MGKPCPPPQNPATARPQPRQDCRERAPRASPAPMRKGETALECRQPCVETLSRPVWMTLDDCAVWDGSTDFAANRERCGCTPCEVVGRARRSTVQYHAAHLSHHRLHALQRPRND